MDDWGFCLIFLFARRCTSAFHDGYSSQQLILVVSAVQSCCGGVVTSGLPPKGNRNSEGSVVSLFSHVSHLAYPSSHNRSGKWLFLKGNYYWRDPFSTSMMMGDRVNGKKLNPHSFWVQMKRATFLGAYGAWTKITTLGFGSWKHRLWSIEHGYLDVQNYNMF